MNWYIYSLRNENICDFFKIYIYPNLSPGLLKPVVPSYQFPDLVTLVVSDPRFLPYLNVCFRVLFSLVRKRGVYYYFMMLTVSWQCFFCTCFVFRCVLHKFFIVRALFTTIFFIFLEPRVLIVSICAFHLVGNFSFSTSIKSITRPFKSRKQQQKNHSWPLLSPHLLRSRIAG